MGTNERKYLISNRFDDLCLNWAKVDSHGDKRGYLYVSDVMEAYAIVARQKENLESPVNNTQQLKASIALVRKQALSHLDTDAQKSKCCDFLLTIEQRASV